GYGRSVSSEACGSQSSNRLLTGLIPVAPIKECPRPFTSPHRTSTGYNAPSRMSEARILNISGRSRGQATVVDLDGAIDIQNSPGLRKALFEKLAETSRLAVNMTGIRYIDSSGIATLIEVLKKAKELNK